MKTQFKRDFIKKTKESDYFKFTMVDYTKSLDETYKYDFTYNKGYLSYTSKTGKLYEYGQMDVNDLLKEYTENYRLLSYQFEGEPEALRVKISHKDLSLTNLPVGDFIIANPLDMTSNKMVFKCPDFWVVNKIENGKVVEQFKSGMSDDVVVFYNNMEV